MEIWGQLEVEWSRYDQIILYSCMKLLNSNKNNLDLAGKLRRLGQSDSTIWWKNDVKMISKQDLETQFMGFLPSVMDPT